MPVMVAGEVHRSRKVAKLGLLPFGKRHIVNGFPRTTMRTMETL